MLELLYLDKSPKVIILFFLSQNVCHIL
jgi:hypothetical protein